MSGETVANAGIYRWSASPAGWERIADTEAVNAREAQAAAEAAQEGAEEAQAAAEAARDQAIAAGAAQNIYPVAARDDVPRGATGTGAITPGSSGTDGTFDLAFTGGNFDVNPMGTFTVESGAVTAISITGPGLYIGDSPTAPTLDFSASANLAGAAATLTVGFLVPAGRYYYAPSEDEGYISQFQNVAGVATLVEEHFDPLSVGAAAAWAEDAETFASDAENAANGLASTLDYFPEVTSANLADPARVDPALPTSADQRWRYYGNIAGNMVAQNETTQGTFGVMKRLPVTPGQQYTHSLKQGPSNFVHYPLSGTSLLFLKADGTTRILESASVTGLNTHTVTFTAPADAAWWLGTIRNFTNYGNGVGAGLTSTAIEQVEAAAMFNTGATALDFQPYAPPGARAPDTAQFQTDAAAPITLEIRSDYTYVRRAAGASATYDIVDRMVTNEVAAYAAPGVLTKTGIIDFQGRRRILKNRAPQYTVADFNSGTVLTIGTDERTPIRLNGVFLGGGHGPNGYEVTKAAHGKTNEDVGSTYTDGAGKVWMIVRIVSSSKFVIVAANTGTSDKWVVAGSLTGTTLTHAAGGTNTGTLTGVTAAATFANQIIRNLDKKIYADGVEVSAQEGLYPCSTLRMVESYEIMNVASWLDYLQANAGTATDPDYTNGAIDTQVEITDVHEWDRYGARVTTRMVKAVQAYRRTAFGSPGDYLQATQAQPAALTGDSQPGIATKKIFYIPRLSSAVSGYNFSARADLTANASNFAVPKTASADPADLPGYAASIGADAGGDLHGYIMGQRRNAGLGKPTSRNAATDTLFYISSAEKIYAVALDALAGDAVAGDIDVIVGFIAPWAEADDDLTVPGVLVPNGKGGYYCYIATTEELSGKAIALPPEMAGWSVTEHMSDADVTLLSDVVTKDGVIISTASGGGDVILNIGPSA